MTFCYICKKQRHETIITYLYAFVRNAIFPTKHRKRNPGKGVSYYNPFFAKFC